MGTGPLAWDAVLGGRALTATTILVISPSLNAEGRKAHSTRGQLFDARVGDVFLVKRSTTPLCDAARALLAEGVDLAAVS